MTEFFQVDWRHTKVIAEIGNAHNGSKERAFALVRAAKDAGAEFVKFQCYTPDELVALRGDGPAPAQWGAQGYTMRTLYEKAATPLAWFPELFALARDIGIMPFSSVFGLDSLKLLVSLDCPAFKIARLDNQNNWLTAAARAFGKPVIVSASDDQYNTGGSYTLYCPPGYPQDEFKMRDGRFTHGVDNRYFSGFSYHGTSIEPCVMAATLGAKLLEVHVQLDEEPSELEASISLTMTQVSELVQRVRDVERWRA